MADVLVIFLFVVRNLAAVTIAAALAMLLCTKQSHAAFRWMVTVALYVVVAALITLLLGVYGYLRMGYALILLVPMAVAAGIYLHRTASLRGFVAVAPSGADLRRASPILALSVGLGFVWFVKYTLGGTYLTFDDKTYHASNAAFWLLSGKVSLTSFSYQSYYPLNGELFSTWLMMPFFTDAAVPFSGLVFATLFYLASLTIGERWGLPLWARHVPVLLYLSSTEIMGQSNWFSDIDIGAPVMLLAAFAVGVAGGDRKQSPVRRIALAGLLVGFSVGMKVTMTPIAVVCLLFLLFSDERLWRPLWALGGSALFGAAALLTGGFWYVRNWLVTGNPVFPAAIGPFDGPFTAADQAQTTILHALGHGEFGPAEWRGLYEAFFNWPGSHAILALGAILYVAVRRGWKRTDGLARALFFSSVICLAIIPIQPFSARGDDGMFYLSGSSRYLSFTYLSGFLLLALCLKSLQNLPWTNTMPKRLGALGLLLVTTSLPFLFERKALALVGGIVAMGIGFSWLEWSARHALMPRFGRFIRSEAAIPVAIVGLLAYVAIVAPINLTATDQTHVSKWLYTEIERLPEGSRLAMYVDLRPEIYSLYGRRLQHHPIPLMADGLPALSLHLRDNRAEYDSFFSYANDIRKGEKEPTPEELVQNIRDSGVDFIITLSISHEEQKWPAEYYLLKQTDLPIFAESEDAVIWDLRGLAVEQPEPLADRDC